MAHTYDHKEFIPMADAWEKAISALCPTPALSVETWTPKRRNRSAKNKKPRRRNSFEKYDDVIRPIEKLMRDAIVDGIMLVNDLATSIPSPDVQVRAPEPKAQ